MASTFLHLLDIDKWLADNRASYYTCRIKPMACNQPMRGNVNCKFPPDHKGRHSSVAWKCDSCSKWSRSQGHNHEMIGKLCFFCYELPNMRKDYYGY